jgi:hypothetical protein
MSSLDIDWNSALPLLRASWTDAVVPSNVFCIDEALFNFRVRKLKKKEKSTSGRQTATFDSPQRFIPRKPHPNGLLCYMAAFKMITGPYVFDLVPDLTRNAPVNPRDALVQVIDRWPYRDIIPHVVADAGFSSDMVSRLCEMKAYFTLSVNKAHKKWLFDLLFHNCSPQSTLAVQRAGCFWSVYRSEESVHFVVSNSPYFVDAAPQRQSLQLLTMEDAKILAKLSSTGLHWLARSMGVNTSINPGNLVTSICYAGGLLPASSSSLSVSVSSSSSSSAPRDALSLTTSTSLPSQDLASSTVVSASSAAKSSSSSSKSVARTPARCIREVYTRSQLNSMVKRDVQAIARSFGLSTSQKKDKLIDSILSMQSIGIDTVMSIQNRLGMAGRKSFGPTHQFYRDHFNAVDQHDKKWYQVQGHHALRNWRAKFVVPF